LELIERREKMPPKNANMQKITAICENLAKKLNYELCDAAMEKEPRAATCAFTSIPKPA